MSPINPTPDGQQPLRPCPNCGHEVAEGKAFCPNCGADMNTAWPPPPEGKTPEPDADADFVRREVSAGTTAGCFAQVALSVILSIIMIPLSLTVFAKIFGHVVAAFPGALQGYVSMAGLVLPPVF
jgi:hypothetical protein